MSRSIEVRIACDGRDCDNYEPLLRGESTRKARIRLGDREGWASFARKRRTFDLCRRCLVRGNVVAA